MIDAGLSLFQGKLGGAIIPTPRNGSEDQWGQWVKENSRFSFNCWTRIGQIGRHESRGDPRSSSANWARYGSLRLYWLARAKRNIIYIANS